MRGSLVVVIVLLVGALSFNIGADVGKNYDARMHQWHEVATSSQSASATPSANHATPVAATAIPPAQILVRMSGNMSFSSNDNPIVKFDTAKSVALALNQRLANSQLYVFSGLDSSGHTIDETSPDYSRPVRPEDLSILSLENVGGNTSLEAAIQNTIFYTPNGSAMIFITSADLAESSDRLLSLKTLESLRDHNYKLIFLVIKSFHDEIVDPIYTMAVEITGGKVIPVDPLNIGAAVNATLDALK